MNERNLKSLASRTIEERREIARKGGRASGEVRRYKKLCREIAQYIGEMPERVTLPNGQEVDGTTNEAIVASIAARAKAGDMRAAELWLRLKGEDLGPIVSVGIEEVHIAFE